MDVYRHWLMGLIVLLIASGFAPGALAVSAEDAQPVGAGALVRLSLSDEPETYAFTPSVNGQYAAYVFPLAGGADARLSLYEGEELLETGEGSLMMFSRRLNAGTEYTLEISGSGSALMEVARETLSRSFGMPLELDDGEGYSKLIARAGDVHWYTVTAQSDGAALIACAPETPGLSVQMWLFSADGQRLISAETLSSGTAVMSAEFAAGESCRIRVAGYGGATGKYSLSMLRSENASRPESVRLSDKSMTLEGVTAAPLTASILPEDACGLVWLDTTDPGTAQAWPSGYVEGRRAGEAVITAYAFGGARSTCRVTVQEVPVAGAEFGQETLTLTEGQSRALPVSLQPANTTQRRLKYVSADESIVTVNENGVATAVRAGAAMVTVESENENVSDEIEIVVEKAPPRYRALLIGEQEYAPTVETRREGSVRSVESVASLLTAASFESGSYQVSSLMDASRDEVIAKIRATFAGAREDDTSLVYITCHGFYQAGMTFFVMADGSVLSAADLERELRIIPGEIVLLADCCGSGGVLGRAGSAQDMLDGVISVFQGAVGSASVHGSKYRVIASARLDQDSHRIGFTEDGMSTVFARALCDAAGWNMDRNAPSAMNADVNYDRKITLDELGRYLTKRVSWYLNLAGGYAQNVCVYPENDPSVVLARMSE